MKKEKVEKIGSYLGIISALILIGTPIFNYFNQPNLNFLKPNGILLKKYQFAPNDEGYLRLASQMSYVNEDNFGKDVIVTKESISFQYYDKTITQEWNTFESFHEDADQNLHSTKTDKFGPFLVDGRSVVSHDTYFAPMLIECGGSTNCNPSTNYIKFDDFVNYVENSLKAQNNRISLKFNYEVEIYEGEKISQICNASLTSAEVSRLKQYGWASVTCF